MPGAVLALGISAVLACAMFGLLVAGFFLVLIVPLFAGFAAGWAVRYAVARGNCRNALVGGLLGLAAGIVTFFGYYYVGMIYHWGPEYAARPDRLPRYIARRMATGRLRSSHDYSDDKSRKPTPTMNWVTFGFQSLLVLGITTAAGVKRAKKPFCESCQRWHERDVTFVGPEQPLPQFGLPAPVPGIEERPLAAVMAEPPWSGFPARMLAVDYCPSLKDGRSNDCPAFVSIKQVKTQPQGMASDRFDAAQGKELVSGLQLERDGLRALAVRIPVFAQAAGVAELPSPQTSASSFPGEPIEPSRDAIIEIRQVDSHSAGQVLTRKRKVMGNLISLLSISGLLGGPALVLWGLTILPDSKGGHAPDPARQVRSVGLMVAGGLLFIGVLGYSFKDSSMGANPWLKRQLRKEIARRSSVFVDANDPDALFVEIVPKSNWGKVMLDNASEVGLLVVDRGRREIRFEGDKERYRIPAAAIMSAEIETYLFGNHTPMFFTVLHARQKQGVWEAPIRERRGAGGLKKKQRVSAEKLCGMVHEIMA